MTTLPLADPFSRSPRDRSPQYSLCWRQKQLLVKTAQQPTQPNLPPLGDSKALTSCLQRSPIQLVRISPDLGAAAVEFWADACAEAGKAIYLNLPSPNSRLKQQKFELPQWVKWNLKRLTDWIAALVLLLLLTPVLLLISGLLWLKSPGPVLVAQWRIGRRGRLFRMLKFRSIDPNVEYWGSTSRLLSQAQLPAVEEWLHQSGLSELPQLINVLCGEMSLVGPRPWPLVDALRLNPAARQQLNGLPGMTGIWIPVVRSPLPDLEEMSKLAFSYLSNWSIRQDFKILLMTIPRAFWGIGPD